MIIVYLYIIAGISFGAGLVVEGVDPKSAALRAAAWPWHLGKRVVGWFDKK